MGWLKLDDGFFLHPKAIAAGRDGRDVFLAALGYANQQQTDGVIPAQSLPLIGGLAGVADYDAAASRLVEVGLWQNHVVGWVIHGFLEYQQSKEEREEWKRRDRERKQGARDAKKARQVPEPVQPESQRNPNGIQAMSAEVPLYRKEVNRSEKKVSEWGGPPASGTPANGSTTTTSDPRIDKALKATAVALARKYARPGEEAGYRASVIRNAADHLDKLAALAHDHPDVDGDELAALYLASRTKPTTQPKCGICGAAPHPNGPIDCPAMNGPT